MPRPPSAARIKTLKCSYCNEIISETHEIYKTRRDYDEATAGLRTVFCCKGHSVSYRHDNLSPEDKFAYHEKIATSRKNRSPEEKHLSGTKLRDTKANFSEEKKADIRSRIQATAKANDSYAKAALKREITLIETHGLDYGKKRQVKARETMLREHGIPCSLVSGSVFRAKAEATNVELYGFHNATMNPQIAAKTVATYTERHGGMGRASPSANAEYKKTMIKEYGTDQPMQVKEFVDKAREKFRQIGRLKSNATKIKNNTTPKEVAWKGHATKKLNGTYTTNKQEQYILHCLRSLLGCQVEYLYRDHPDYPWEADFYDPDSDTIFEYQGYFTHGDEAYDKNNKQHKLKVADLSTKEGWAPALTLKIWTKLDPLKRKTAKNKNLSFVEWFNIEQFHVWFYTQIAKLFNAKHSRVKSGWFKLAPDYYLASHCALANVRLPKGRIIVFYPWDDLKKLSLIISKEKEIIYARKTKISIITKETADKFCEKYHMQGSCRGTDLALGLYVTTAENNNRLVGVMTFGNPRYNKKFDYELLRLCFSSLVVGGSQKLWSAANKYLTGSVISYCDLSKFSGAIYTKLGFIQKNKPKSSIVWYNPESGIRITDNLLRQRGFDQLIGKKLGIIYGKGESNNALMKKYGFIPVQDQGQSVYITELK